MVSVLLVIVKLRKFLYSVFIIISYPSQSTECLDAFAEDRFKGSQRWYQAEASKTNYPHLPRFSSMKKEAQLAGSWRGTGVKYELFQNFFPRDVSFIGHALRESPRPYLVKFEVEGSVVIARGAYSPQGKKIETNIAFSDFGLANNPENQQKWLIGPDVSAGVLFLHGGGTKSTGGHVAHAMINHFKKYNVAFISPDLSWHAEGPRVIMGSLDQEIMALSDFVKKYVHPRVPLFVWGHSWGGSLAHRLMQMSGEKEKGFFHNNLKGLIITSPAIDSAPGKSIKEKRANSVEIKSSIFNEHKANVSPIERDIFKSLVLNGKISPVGSSFASLTISQLNDMIPDHKGADYLPALMIVGQGDQLVYVGYEKLFESYYGKLTNVSSHYLERRSLIVDPNQEHIVGHLLSDYRYKKDDSIPVNFKLAADFIRQEAPEIKTKHDPDSSLAAVYSILKLYSNNLAFRKWVELADIVEVTTKGNIFQELSKEYQKLKQQLKDLIVAFHPIVWLSNDLQNDKNLKNKEIDETIAEARIEILSRFQGLISHQSFPAFLEKLKTKKIKTMGAYLAAVKELEQQNVIYPSSGEKTKKIFFQEFEGFIEAGNLPAFFEKYFYISQSQQDDIKTLLKKIEDIKVYQQEMRIPSPEDFFNLSEEKIEERINSIKKNVEARQKLKEKISALQEEIKRLKKQFNQIERKLVQYMKKVKITFEDAEKAPPISMVNDYKESEQDFLNLYDFSQKLQDKMEDEVVGIIESENITIDALNDITEKHEKDINKFEVHYNDFTEQRKKIRRTLIDLIREGGLTEEQAQIFNSLYGDIGLYKDLDRISLNLAEKEVQYIALKRQLANHLQKYHKLQPGQALSEVTILPVRDILSSNPSQEALMKILKEWNWLGSKILPPLPE